jgi:hypothetical protein
MVGLLKAVGAGNVHVSKGELQPVLKLTNASIHEHMDNQRVSESGVYMKFLFLAKFSQRSMIPAFLLCSNHAVFSFLWA